MKTGEFLHPTCSIPKETVATENQRRAISYLRLSPPRADDHKLLDAYAAIGISEASLRADRDRRHSKRTEKMTASYQRLHVDEEVEMENGVIDDGYYIRNERQETDQTHIYFDEEIKDRVVMDHDTIQNERDKVRAGNICVPYENLGFVEGEMRNRLDTDNNAAQTVQDIRSRMDMDDDEWLHGFPDSPGPPLDL
jgi:hypothetical protein